MNRSALAVGIALALALSSVAPAMAQEKKTGDAMKSGEMKTGVTAMNGTTVQGTVKSAQADGIVVTGKAQAKVNREPGSDREWAFAINEKTSIKRGQTAVMAADLKPGDEVTVSYTEDGGKVIAQSVIARDGGSGTPLAPARDVPAGQK